MDDADTLILVDEADREVGYMSKTECHDGGGVLHRAFSLLIFNAAGEVLLQRRAATKRLWPLYWSNSCCSHPRRFESMEVAIQRRLFEELHVRCPLQFLFKFQYQAQWDSNGAENELCSVYIGRTRDRIEADPDEVADLRWVTPGQLQVEMAQRRPGQFTPWFRMEWERLWNDHRPAVVATCS
jgi:isopentenyl-diphosphate delta-isomerase